MMSRGSVGVAGLGAAMLMLLAGCNLGGAAVTYELIDETSSQISGGGMDAGDIDSDGDLDVVVAGRGVGVLVNDGAGSFTAEHARATNFGAHGNPSLVDIDGDDDLDILTLASPAGPPFGPVVQLNDGSGAFGDPTPLTSAFPVEMTALVASDADGDGDADLLAAFRVDNDRHVGVYLNEGSGTFGDPVTYPLGLATDSATPVRLVAGDLDGDGDDDVVATDVVRVEDPDFGTREETHAMVALNDGAGAFTTAGTPFKVGPVVMIFALTPTLADFNEDGHLDIAAGENVALGDGTGAFAAPLDSGTGPPSFDLIAAGDIDSDGHADLVGFNDVLKPGAGTVLYGDGLGGLPEAHGLITGTNVGGDGTPAGQVELADIDDDGDPDVLFLGGAGLGVMTNYNGGRPPG